MAAINFLSSAIPRNCEATLFRAGGQASDLLVKRDRASDLTHFIQCRVALSATKKLVSATAAR